MLTDKEKLEEELRFLEESYQIGVITKDEYESGKQRIESKLNIGDDNAKEKAKPIEEKTIGRKDSIKETFEEKPAEKKELITEGKEEPIENKISKKEAIEKPIGKKESLKEEEEKETVSEPIEKEGTIKEGAFKKEAVKKPAEEAKEEPLEERVPIEKEAKADKAQEIEKKVGEDEAEQKELEDGNVPPPEKKEPVEPIPSEDGFNKKILAYSLVFLVVAAGVLYFLFLGKGDIAADDNLNLVVCNSDSDCKLNGKTGKCANPGEQTAECLFSQEGEVKLVIINSDACFNCNTSRVVSILQNFYPNLDIKKLDSESDEGRAMIEEFGVNALPAYILNSSVAESENHDMFSSAFKEVNGKFVLKNNVANANYYLNRDSIPKKLDLFLQSDQEASLMAEKNLEQFLEVFEGKVVFEKHDEDSQIAKALGINSFPAYLVNNQNKFGGVQPSATIKDNFCKLNVLEECELELSKSLV